MPNKLITDVRKFYFYCSVLKPTLALITEAVQQFFFLNFFHSWHQSSISLMNPKSFISSWIFHSLVDTIVHVNTSLSYKQANNNNNNYSKSMLTYYVCVALLSMEHKTFTIQQQLIATMRNSHIVLRVLFMQLIIKMLPYR